jgi:hypothetical protein
LLLGRAGLGSLLGGHDGSPLSENN